jgi:diguanylate cyclase (GGDEF)-like protein
MIDYDRILAALCLLGAVGLVLFNIDLPFPVSLYQAFTLPLLPIAFNLLIGLRFVYAAPLAVCYLGLFLTANLMRAEFPPQAKFFLALSLALPTFGSLIANYRVELAERVNFLRQWRDNLRSVEIAKANRQLDALSRADPLTGLANRREFDACFAAQTERSRVEGAPLALVVLDIDHFKLYNDRLGHPQGDKCIQAVARALSDAIGPAPNFAGRIGGEEFAAVLPRASVDAAAAVAQKIRRAVECMELSHPALGESGVVSVSLGVACFNPARPETTESLMGRADAALYRAKGSGRDRAEVDLRLVGT